MPRIARFYLRHVLIGYVLSAAFTALLLWQDVAGLWHLVTHVEGGWLAVVMLWLFNGIVFAGAQFGIAVMAQAGDDESPDGT